MVIKSLKLLQAYCHKQWWDWNSNEIYNQATSQISTWGQAEVFTTLTGSGRLDQIIIPLKIQTKHVMNKLSSY